MKTLLCVVLITLGLTNVTFASEAAASRLQNAARVLDEIMATPDKGIPEEILGSAKCIAVVPSLLKGGFIVGGAHGRGMATCRLGNNWSAPAPLTTTGGSIGLQIGGQAVDVIMIIMNDHGMQQLLTNKFKLGADASVAAGPVGRHVEGSTDWKLNAEVLTYSRARGLFAGITFNGAVIKQDEDATGELYGRMVDFKTILTGASIMPRGADVFLAAIRKASGSEAAPPLPPSPSSTPATTTPVNPPAAPTPTPITAPPPPAQSEPTPSSEPAPAPAPTPSMGTTAGIVEMLDVDTQKTRPQTTEEARMAMIS